MSFADHKITEFTHRITDLPDQPTLSPRELKARFDSSPEELRRAHNAVCDEGERLSARVEGIVTDTFGDTIDREMLSHELAAELDAKADETANQAAHEALHNRLLTAENTLPQKVGIYCGSYTGNGEKNRSFKLGFRPKAVILTNADYMSNHGGFVYMAGDGHDTGSVQITDTGFSIVMTNGGFATNYSDTPYFYIAFR